MQPKYLFLCILFLPFTIFGQDKATLSNSEKTNTKQQTKCPLIYIGVNSGIENPNGIVGVSVDIAPVKGFSAGAGVGLSSWGTKYFAEIRGYMGECHRQWAGGLGITHNTGLRGFNTDLETVAGTQEVTLDLDPVTNVFFNFYRFWNLGKRMNRVYFSFGYSFRLDQDVYSVKSSYKLSQKSEDVMDRLAPGGLSLGVGFYFDVTGKRN